MNSEMVQLSWPEDDPNHERNIFVSIYTRLCYPYMNPLLEKGSKLHKQRVRPKEGNSSQITPRSRHEDNQEDGNSISSNSMGINNDVNVVNELSQNDLFLPPSGMDSDTLQKKFQHLFEKLQEHENDNSSNLTPEQIQMKRKWDFIKILWIIAKPTYLPAAFYQLLTVICQTLYPLAVKRILELLDENPGQSFIRQGMPYAILIFLSSIIDGIAQERHKYLAFQSGIAVRAATVASVYHHMLNLSSEGMENLTTGEVTNLVATDCQKLFEVMQEGHLIWSCPLSMIVVLVLLLLTLGPVTLVGMASMILLIPLMKLVVGMMMKTRKKRAIFTDKRVETTTAMLQAIRFCKLNHYEAKFLKRIKDTRREEVKWVRRELALLGVTMLFTVLSPVFACSFTFIVYVFIDEGNTLSSSDSFTVLLLFFVLRFPINYVGKLLGKVAQGLEACQRLSQFFARESHLKQQMVKDNSVDTSVAADDDNDENLIEITNGNFTIGGGGGEGEGTQESDIDSADESFVGNIISFKLSNINLSVKKSEVLTIVGPVGCGKSTLLKALIGDIAYEDGTKIDMHGCSVSYASQSPFILNATVRENILFGLEYDEDLYRKVITACKLEADLKQLGPAEDLTEIGERGVTLSGGQKARVSLARCVYSQPSVALLDDVLSALDAETGKWVFEHIFESTEVDGNHILSNSAVILVTHASHFLSRVDKILVLVKGMSAFFGSWDELTNFTSPDPSTQEVISSICSSVQENKEWSDNMEAEGADANNTAVTEPSETVDDPDIMNPSAIMTVEERDYGLSDSQTWMKWWKSAGGFPFFISAMLFLSIDRFFYVANEWWLAVWTGAELVPTTRFGVYFHAQIEGFSAQAEFVKVYVIILAISFVGTLLRSQWLIQGGARCSEKLFYAMIGNIIYAPMEYFETTPIGRILNRLTYDVEILDVTLSTAMTILMTSSGWFLTGVVLMVTILPWVLIVLVPTIVLYWLLLKYYRKAATDLQRLDAVSRSPIQGKLAEGMDGASVIRVFDKRPHFESLFKVMLDSNISAMMNFMTAQRWLGVRFQVLGSFVVLFSSIFVVCFNDRIDLETGIIAMLIIWSSNFTITLSFFSQSVSESEAHMTSVERVCSIIELPQEEQKRRNSSGIVRVPSSWPKEGVLAFEDVCLRYRSGLPLALKGLTFSAKSGQRVGICGRTGAGKSTIAVALFRLAEIECGRITLDNHDLSTLDLADIRGRQNGMCIIPQDPVLFQGQLRECVDPWASSTDEDILEALQAVRIANVQERGLSALDDFVDEGGRNFSVGERQLLCLARAILAKPKVLVLDEATASVDGETDALMQQMIRDRFEGSTLLTIAHRLNTIMDYDVILVMDDGKVGEIGPPSELLKNPNGLFSALVDSTGRESAASLRRMVESKR